MSDHKKPPNWVADRARCNVIAIFDALQGIIERDVEEANALPDDVKGHVGFEVEEYTGGIDRAVTVSSRKGAELVAAVRFVMGTTVILVDLQRGGDIRRVFTVIPRWEDGECRTYVSRPPEDSEESSVELWQVSKLALEPLFFRSS